LLALRASLTDFTLRSRAVERIPDLIAVHVLGFVLDTIAVEIPAAKTRNARFALRALRTGLSLGADWTKCAHRH
jgi:hypothetical protein